jgi:hypothetical protein
MGWCSTCSPTTRPNCPSSHSAHTPTAEEIGALVVDEAVGQYEKKSENFPGGLDTAKEIERDVMLQILDQRWRDHLSDMDYLRDGIHLRQVAQQDPLTAWQKEGYLMFEHLLEAVDIDYVRYITHVEATAAPAIEESTLDEGLEGALTNVEAVATELPAHANAVPSAPTNTSHEKLGRNDPCWCGSKSQVQAVSWPTLRQKTPYVSPWSPWKSSRPGGSAAREYLKIDASRARHALLYELAADPNLWDDQDNAREVTTELGRLTNDLDSV